LHSDEVFDTFGKLSKKKKIVFITTEEEFEVFCKTFIGKCSTCNSQHNSLYTCYETLDEHFKNRIVSLINEILTDEFKSDIYLNASIYGIIDYREYWETYLVNLGVPRKRHPHPFEHLSGELFYRELNELLNITFKYNIEIPANLVSKYSGLSDYYDWLLNLYSFNYKKFKPLWIIQYPTIYYLKKIFAIKEVKEHVRSYLKSNNQPVLANYYSEYVLA
jgi:hypothetical protein